MFLRNESLKQYIKLYPVTTVLICVHLIVLGLMEWTGSSQDAETLLRFGALFDLPGMTPEWWRYLTAMFVHIGFAHMFFNSFTLYVFAPPLERMLGTWRYLLFYILSGIAGNLASAWLHPDHFISAGASGAIYGVYAAYLFLAIFRKDIIDRQTKQTIITILVIGFLQSIIVPHIDLYAHFGGFVGGLIVMGLISLSIQRRQKRHQEEQRQQASEG
ncbi:rhomboid family intramembrane serine protease [Paenibacillus rigui]|uniref:Rhomboid family intramembrane serine protease n=1 Tax=Paenibacillus rigui TaxID=554312 RepID=A0A229UJ73_9BACL|nr:rhomboid family intramembrane serine protease [Paenibacillus rigui]OXM83507.1 rhomboid family intramembrane serine protease [Paenibacillus rigui]